MVGTLSCDSFSRPMMGQVLVHVLAILVPGGALQAGLVSALQPSAAACATVTLSLAAV
jgi:hypothetical protein